MTFNDIFKSSFLEKAVDFSIVDIVVALALSFCVGLFIFFVYKKTYSGVMYSSSFGVSLIAMSLVTTLVILAITSNLVLSLGMVGALSIVRFRTAIKEPMDIVFLFWSIAAGIVVGAGLIPLAVIGSIIIGIVLIVFANHKTNDTPYVIIMNIEDDKAENEAMKVIATDSKKRVVKSKTVSANGIELIVEIRLAGESTSLVNQLLAIPGITYASLVSYNGEYTAS